jgi:hypothetical protein
MPSSSRCQMMLASVGGRPFLHPHFIIQILNDVYGIQARAARARARMAIAFTGGQRRAMYTRRRSGS